MQETSQGMKTLLRCSSEPTTAGRQLRTPPRPCSWSWTAAAGAPSRWPAAAGSPGRACPPTAIPGSPRSCRARRASTSSTGQARELRGSGVAGCTLPRVGIWAGELESAFSCCRPEGRGRTMLLSVLCPFPLCSALHFLTVLDFQEASGVLKAHVLQMVRRHPSPRPPPSSRLRSLPSSCACVLRKPFSGNRLPFSHLLPCRVRPYS